MRVLEIADGVQLCTLTRDLTGAPNWEKQFSTDVVTGTLTKRRRKHERSLSQESTPHSRSDFLIDVACSKDALAHSSDQLVDGTKNFTTSTQNVKIFEAQTHRQEEISIF